MSTQNLLFPQPDEHDPGGKTRIRIPLDWTGTAELSDCGRYRYKLIRRWEEGKCVLFLMMNPSTADHEHNDPTVAKCCRLARRWGYGGVFVGNACAYRATDRMRLLDVEDPVGPRNYQAIREMAANAGMIVVAHGQLPGKLQEHARTAVQMLRDAGYALHVLRIQNGQPIHPLARGKSHVAEDTVPILWE